MELIIIITTFVITALINILLKRRVIIEFLSLTASVVAFGESVSIALQVSSNSIYFPYQFFSVDSLGAIVMLIISVVGFAATVYSVAYLRQETAKKIIGFTRVKQYFILLPIFLAAMFLAITASNPVVAWIAIEATTLSTAFLISFYNKPSAMEGAWKYLMINSTGLLLGFFGMLLYFTAIHSTAGGGFISWQILTANAAQLDPFMAKIAFIFVLVGFGTKMGLAPMHTWLPDAHGKAPAPISALLSGVLLNVALVIILRFKILTDMSDSQFTSTLFIIFGLLSLFIAAFIMITQKKYKRLLAYSSIENMGIITLGFGFGGVGISAAILHMIYHSFVKSFLFFSSGNLLLRYGSAKIQNVKGALNAVPITSILFISGFFVVTGIPPFGMFLTKMGILSAGITTHPVAGITALFLTVLVFVSFLKVVTAMFFGEKPDDIKTGEENAWLIISPAICIIIILWLSFHLPGFLQSLINNAVLHYSL